MVWSKSAKTTKFCPVKISHHMVLLSFHIPTHLQKSGLPEDTYLPLAVTCIVGIWEGLSPEFWSWKFWSPGPKFSVEKWSPRTHFFGTNGPPMEIWSGLCKLERQSLVHLIHVRKSFPCLLLLHFHTSLFPSGAFLWLVGKFSPGTALGASASAPIKAHHRFVSRKTSYLRRFFSFVVTYLGCLMLLTTCSAEPYPFHKRQLRSNIVLVLGPLFQVQTKFLGENGLGGPLFLSPGPIFSPDQNFCDRSMAKRWKELVKVFVAAVTIESMGVTPPCRTKGIAMQSSVGKMCV